MSMIESVLIAQLLGYGVFAVTYILGYALLLFNIPQKLMSFIVYHVYTRFFPDKFNELEFYTNGTWRKRVDEISMSDALGMLVNAQQKMIELRYRVRQQSQGMNNPTAAKDGTTETEIK